MGKRKKKEKKNKKLKIIYKNGLMNK